MRAFWLLSLLIIPDCARDQTDPLTFLNPLLVQGVQRPSPVDGLASNYDIALQILCVRWNPSIDPETQKEVPAYRLYLYFVYPPTSFYSSEDLLDEVVGREHCFETGEYTGMLTVVVTGYDGFAESLPSAPLSITLP